MVLDCNAENNPKYTRGEPGLIRIPLETRSIVKTVTLNWADRSLLGLSYRMGRAREFDVCALLKAGGSQITNCAAFTSTGRVDVVAVNAESDELLLRLNRRATGIDFYGLAEIEVNGGRVSLPTATTATGDESRLDSQHSILFAVDNSPSTWWASGPESEVRLMLPLERQSSISQVNLQWNCKTTEETGRLGRAAEYQIWARDETTGTYFEVPFVSHDRTADDREVASFGTAQSTNTIVTDRIMLVLTGKAQGVDHYSLKEVTLQRGFAPVPLRMPSANNSLSWDVNYALNKAFDGNTATEWASGSQGMLAAAAVEGNNMKLSDLQIIGFGTKAGRECFPLYIFANTTGTAPAHLGNVLVQDCIFHSPATNNTDGVTIVVCAAQAPNTVTNALIRRCVVRDLKPYFTYSQGFTANRIEHCTVQNCHKAVYFEPDPAVADNLGPVLVLSNQFVYVNQGIYLSSHPGAQFDSLTCLGNEIILTSGLATGIGSCDVCSPGPSGTIRALIAVNNIVRFPDWTSTQYGSSVGVFYTDIQHGVFVNNVVALASSSGLRVRQCPAGVIYPPPPKEDCDGVIQVSSGNVTYPACLDTLPPGYRRAWSNNRDLSGSLLDVRFSSYGVDGMASQQQWRE